MRYFGSSGIRGLVNKWLTPELALKIGRAVGREYGEVVIGTDTRPSCQMVTAALTAGLTAQGADVYNAGILPTPSLAFAAERYDCGVMVTASHNTAPYNGVKLWNPDGSAFNTEQMLKIEEHIDSPSPLPGWRDIGIVGKEYNVVEKHMDAILNRFGNDHSLKVVVDCASGAAYGTTPILLRKMGCSVISLNATPDGTFPAHRPEPTEDNLRSLKDMVLETGADLGIGHDGDGDRMVGFSSSGAYLGGDLLLALFAKTRPEKVVVPINSSMIIEDIAEEVVRTRVGDVYVAEVLKEQGGSFGGEPSGTWIFPEMSFAPDAIYAAAVLVDLAGRHELDDLIHSLPEYPKRREAFPVDDKAGAMKALEKLYKDKYTEDSINTIDGLRVEHHEGWSLVRASGTEPKVRITAEARCHKRLESIYQETKAMLNEVI